MSFLSPDKERLALDLCIRTVEQVVKASGLQEVTGADGGALRTLTNDRTGDAVGKLRVWQGDGVVRKAVYAGIWADVPGVISLDSHMVFVFTAPDSAVPHFTLDSVERGDLDTHAFHLDLIPRVDLATHLSYIDEVFEPILPSFNAGKAIDGLSAAEIGPRQRALMSPYMLAYRATPEAYRQLDDYVNAYLGQFLDLSEKGLSEETAASIADTDLAVRDEGNRALIFNPEVDAVWHHIIPLVGAENSELIRRNLAFNELTTEVQV
jgi:hypothetical protein